MGFDPNQPYNDLPPLPPPVDLETRATLKAALRASRTLAQLKGVGDLMPNPAILVEAVSLQEARHSSEIEGIVTTNDRLYRALSETSDSADDPHAKEVLRYSNAMWHGYRRMKEGRPLSTSLYEELVQTIKQNEAGVRKVPGTTLKDLSSGHVVYTPPIGEPVLRDKLANLDEYIHADDGVDPLIKLAVIHYQFEAIHPFTDGNGRTGRIVNILYLVHAGLLDLPVLFLSGHIIEHKINYYRGLQAVTAERAWEPWVLFMLEAVERTALDTLRQITAIRDLMADFGNRVREKARKAYSRELIDELFSRPYCKIAYLIEAGIAKRQTASQHLRSLADVGLLTPVKLGREIFYVNMPFLELLQRPYVAHNDMSAERVEKS